VAETLRLALEALGDYRPDWLRTIALPHWYERYSLRLTDFRVPKSPEKREALALEIARDGFYLLETLQRSDVPSQAANLPALQVLAQVWQQQFRQDDQGPHWRQPAEQPPAGQLLSNPHDPAVRYATHGEHHWQGYAVHWTETCDAGRPHLITNVALPAASTGDASLLAQIHAALARRQLLPKEHLVDAGYVTGPNLATSAQDYGVHLVGPVEAQQSWQARQLGAFTIDDFTIDWDQQQATCPQGQPSSKWSHSTDKAGQPIIEIAFPKQVCDACPLRQQCTHSTTRGRNLSLSVYRELVQARRLEQATEAFKQAYALRAGMEGTISATVRQHGMRRSRYFDQSKTELQAWLTGIAVNVRRIGLWLMGEKPAAPRPPGLHCLAPA
jgi:transposase